MCCPKGEEIWQQHKFELLGVSLTEAGMAKTPFEALEVSFAFKSGLRPSLRAFGHPKTVEIKMRETCADESYFSFFAIESSPAAQKLILSIFRNLPFWAYKLK